nr:hypothetical protein [uncultured Dyadobacter sp.]
MADNENEVSDLCVSCGMCCDGTLFEKGAIRNEKDRGIADNLEMGTFELHDKLFFKMPCCHFSSCCTIYESLRPNICSDFFCVPLKKYQKGEQTFGDAKQQVQWLFEYREKLLKAASQFPETKDLNFKELKAKLEMSSGDNEKVNVYKDLFLLFFLFENVRKKYFRLVKAENGSVS